MSKKVFTKKEVNKLLFSETIKKSKVPWLLELLNPETGLNRIDLDFNQLQVVNEMRADLLNNSIEEWTISKGSDDNVTLDMGPDNKKWKECQLCGTKNRYIHYIKNKFTNLIINIGSDCVDEFGEIGIVAQKDRRSLVTVQARNRRLVKLLEEIPNAKSRVEKWNLFLGELDVILPKKIEETYLKLGEKAEKTLKKILSKNNNDREVSELKNAFLKQEKYKIKIIKYADLNINKHFVFKRKIDEWLRINRAKDYGRIKEAIQEEGNGFISSDIAYEINEPDFLKMLADEYSNNIEPDILKVKQITNNGFVISVAPLFNIELEISNKIFTKEYGSFAYGEDGLFENELALANSRCHSISDKSKLIEEYKKVLSDINMNVVNIDSKNNRIDIENLNPKKYYREDLDKFIEKNKLLLYLNKQEELKKEIWKNNNSFTESEFKNLIKREEEIKRAYYEDIKR